MQPATQKLVGFWLVFPFPIISKRKVTSDVQKFQRGLICVPKT